MKFTIFGIFITICVLEVPVPVSSRSDLDSKKSVPNTCGTDVKTCAECLQKPQCVWCADKPERMTTALDGSIISRCAPSFTTEECGNVVNLTQSVKTSGQATFMTPTSVTLNLRKDAMVNISATYRQPEDYPVDLYFLLDLSSSMKDDKEKLSKLGVTLADSMKEITKDFRLGFGSFVDKTVLPFARMVLTQNETRDGLVLAYGFQHHLKLTSDATSFETRVRDTEVSTNIDAPEGGLEALIQALVCDEIGWRKDSRKIIILATDAEFHSAGDGRLAGIITPNDLKCHLTPLKGSNPHNEYLYDWDTKHDYPSISQVANLAAEKKVNVIFAVTKDKTEIYEKLAKRIEGAATAMLTNDSSNIVDIVRKEYEKITGTVSLTGEPPSYISLKYYSKCTQNGSFVSGSSCSDIKKGSKVDFQIEVALTDCAKANENDTFDLSPVGIQEKIIFNLKNMCHCPCEATPELSSDSCGKKGNLICGACQCDNSTSGDLCECDLTQTSLGGEDKCTLPGQTEVCSGEGECKCKQCLCKYPFKGEYCECDDESCPSSDGVTCSGPDHGKCDCGTCYCKPDWSGPQCECSKNEATCKAPGASEVCSGKGNCVCGKCQCTENAEGRYTGAVCEVCPKCNAAQCNAHQVCVHCAAFDDQPPTEDTNCNACNETVIKKVEKLGDVTPDERLCRFNDKKDCTYKFVYSTKQDNSPIRVLENKECPEPAPITAIAGGVVGLTLLIGLFLILLWRLMTYIHDKREYAKFLDDQQNAQWGNGTNPIYKEAQSNFANPAYGKGKA